MSDLPIGWTQRELDERAADEILRKRKAEAERAACAAAADADAEGRAKAYREQIAESRAQTAERRREVERVLAQEDARSST